MPKNVTDFFSPRCLLLLCRSFLLAPYGTGLFGEPGLKGLDNDVKCNVHALTGVRQGNAGTYKIVEGMVLN